MVDITIPSNILNLINFLLFDVLMCALIFFITGDIAGLLNARTALERRDARLSPYNPPVLGVGLTCTRRRHFYGMAFVRLLAILLFFVTNFLIEGKATPRIVTKRTAMVTTLGHIVENKTLYSQLPTKRRECQGFTEKFMYYGEIRDGNECVTQYELIQAPVMFALEPVYIPIYMQNDSCNITILANNSNYHQRCNHATIKCRGPPGRGPISCAGVLQYRGRDFLCQDRLLYKHYNGKKALCREVRGANLDEKYWMPAFEQLYGTIQETFDAMYMSGKELRLVRDVEGIRNVSDVREVWFVILDFVCVAVFALIAWSLHLRYVLGLVPCANGEVGLANLLALNAPDSIDGLPNPATTRSSNRTSPSTTTDSFLFVRYTDKGDIATTRGGPL